MASIALYTGTLIAGIFFNVICGSKILLLPAPVFSHCNMASNIGQELLARGHQVSIFLPDYFNNHYCHNRTIDNKKIRMIKHRTKDQGRGFERIRKVLTSLVERTHSPTVFTLTNIFATLAEVNCGVMFADTEALLKLREEKFDFVIMGGSYPFSYCFVAIPYKLGIPYATFSTFDEDIITGRPFMPSIAPDALTVFNGDMSFFQRAKNTAVQLYARLKNRWSFPRHILSEFAPELSAADVERLVSQSELFLKNIDPVLGYPVPRMPNHIFVGGLTTRPPDALPQMVEKFYDTANNGVILVSFGSIFSTLPENIHQKLQAALRRVETKVLWKYSGNNDAGNIKQITWLPQNDLLGNTKTRLFVSHCGNNGVFEALYHGIPVVCTPLIGDQFFNAARVVSWDVGRQISLVQASEEEIYQIITQTLNNSTVRANMARASEIYRSQPMNARQRAAFWIEHVIRFGGNHLRSRTAGMSVISALGYDVWAAVIVFVIFISWLVFCFLRMCSLKLCRGLAHKIKAN